MLQEVKKILILADPDPKHYSGLCYAHSQFDLGTLLQCSDIGGFFFLRRRGNLVKRPTLVLAVVPLYTKQCTRPLRSA